MAKQIFGWLSDRALHAYHIAIRPVWGFIFILVVGVMLTLYQTIITVAIPPDKRNPWDIYNLLPKWQSWAYVAIGAVIIVLLIIEGSFRHHQRTEAKLKEALAALAEPSPLRIVFDDADPFGSVQVIPLNPPRLIVSVGVENIGGKHLEQCQVRVRFNMVGWQESYMALRYSQQASCSPFSLRPDDSRLVQILSTTDPQYVDPQDKENQNYLSVFSFDETPSGSWRESGGIPILVPGNYEMVVEAFSANARKVSLSLDINYENDNWIIRKAQSL